MVGIEEWGIQNAISTSLLAVPIYFCARWIRRPAVSHVLYLGLLLKFLSPVLVQIPFPVPFVPRAACREMLAEFSPLDDGLIAEVGAAGDGQNRALSGGRSQVLVGQGSLDRDGAKQMKQMVAARLHGIFLTTVKLLKDQQLLSPPRMSPGDLLPDSRDARQARRRRPSGGERGSAEGTETTSRPLKNLVGFRGVGPLVGRGFAGSPAATMSAIRSRWPRFRRGLFLCWGIGCLTWLGLQSLLWLRFSRFLHGFAYPSALLQERADATARRLGLPRSPTVLVVRGVVSPTLWGLGRGTRILMPQHLASHLPLSAQSTLVAHELAHFRRGDQWVRLLEMLVTVLFWWHPVAWWLRREIEIAEEYCCDSWVVSCFPHDCREYAEALLDTVDFVAGTLPARVPLASGVGQVPYLRSRLVHIMSRRETGPLRLNSRQRAVAFVAALAVMPCALELHWVDVSDWVRPWMHRAAVGWTMPSGFSEAPAFDSDPAARKFSSAPNKAADDSLSPLDAFARVPGGPDSCAVSATSFAGNPATMLPREWCREAQIVALSFSERHAIVVDGWQRTRLFSKSSRPPGASSEQDLRVIDWGVGTVSCGCFLSSGGDRETAVLGRSDGRIQTLELTGPAHSSLRTIYAESSGIVSLDASSRGDWMAACNRDGDVILLDASNGWRPRPLWHTSWQPAPDPNLSTTPRPRPRPMAPVAIARGSHEAGQGDSMGDDTFMTSTGRVRCVGVRFVPDVSERLITIVQQQRKRGITVSAIQVWQMPECDLIDQQVQQHSSPSAAWNAVTFFTHEGDIWLAAVNPHGEWYNCRLATLKPGGDIGPPRAVTQLPPAAVRFSANSRWLGTAGAPDLRRKTSLASPASLAGAKCSK